MLRKLLTLLAVISGFTLVAEPARALDANVVSVSEAASASGDCVVIVGRPLELGRQQLGEVDASTRCKRIVIRTWAPAVILKADRARE